MKTARDYRVTLSLEVVNRYEHYLLNTAGEGEGGGGDGRGDGERFLQGAAGFIPYEYRRG